MLLDFIEQLSRDLGLTEPPPPAEDGSYTLTFDPELQISLRENPESGITLGATLAPLPAENREDFFLKAMCANLLGKETGGSALGLDREGKQVTLTDFLPAHLSYRDFHDLLEDFVNYADVWREETIENHGS